MSKRVIFCGKEYSEDGIKYDPERTKTLMNTPIPLKSVDLMSLLCSLNWNRDSLPRYAEKAQPLNELIEDVYTIAGSRSKQAICKVQ